MRRAGEKGQTLRVRTGRCSRTLQQTLSCLRLQKAEQKLLRHFPGVKPRLAVEYVGAKYGWLTPSRSASDRRRQIACRSVFVSAGLCTGTLTGMLSLGTDSSCALRGAAAKMRTTAQALLVAYHALT
jgi:hypothetical protein